MFTHEEKRELLLLAREAVECAVKGSKAPPGAVHLPGLKQISGLFVTLRSGVDLRGCIGYIDAVRPLGYLVPEVAAKSALEDPRFTRVSTGELDEISIELSVLSPFRRIQSIEQIIVGTHGLMLELGSQRGLLLPQVAREYRWGREEFLSATAQKAGLYRLAWKDPGVQMFVFEAEVIHEMDVFHDNEPSPL